jgi:hypothetical protein
MVYWTSIYTFCNKKIVLTSEINIIASSSVLCCAVDCSEAPGQLMEEVLLVSFS